MTGKRRGLGSISAQGGLLGAMALAGLFAVALTVTADRGNAGGIDGLRAVIPGPGAPAGLLAPPPVLSSTAVPAGSRPPPATSGSAALPGTPLPGTVVPDPTVAASPAPGPAPAAAPTRGPDASTPAAAPGAGTPQPSASPVPAAQPAPAITPLPAATPTPATPPPATPVPTPTPTPAPVALVTDRGATALVSLGDLVPGDVITRTMAVRNTGTSAFRYAVL
ncbi:MAG TPA: hypothetical protein VM070_01290 [Candidatus Saccharimonadales bacterium]|nr:hypothetical protein [Candidatus Saccharimonadales bacterium]